MIIVDNVFLLVYNSLYRESFAIMMFENNGQTARFCKNTQKLLNSSTKEFGKRIFESAIFPHSMR